MKRFMMFLAVAGLFLAPHIFAQQMTIARAWPDSLSIPYGKSVFIWDMLVAKNGNVFAATVGDVYYPGSVYCTSDNGQNWTNLWDGGLNGLTSTWGFGICQNPVSGAIILGTWDGIFRSTDNGKTWTQPTAPAPYQIWKLVRKFAINGDSVIYAGTRNGILASRDGGQNWATVFYDAAPNDGRKFSAMDITIAPNGTIFVATDGQGILRCINGMWSYANSGLGSMELSTVACDGNGTVYAGTFGSEGLYRSTDNGENWQNIGFANNSVYDILVIRPDLIFIANLPAGAPGGVFKGNGISWQKIGPEPTDGVSLAFKGNDLWIGTSDGVWRATDIITGVEVSEPVGIPSGFTLHQNFPNPFNPNTTIEFALPNRANVILMVYNTIGQKVETIVSGELNSGIHQYVWNTGKYPSGIYFSVLETANFKASRKMLLVK